MSLIKLNKNNKWMVITTIHVLISKHHDRVCAMIRIELLLVFISINSKVVFSFYFSFLFSFNVVALTSSTLATLSPYRYTSIC